MKAETKNLIEALRQKSTPKDLANLPRFGIAATNPLGVSMAHIQAIAKQFGKNHEVAQDLWATNIYEARLLCAYIDDPAQVSSAQMDRWCRDCDNWGLVDTLCFKLFDQTKHAWHKVPLWAKRQPEFERRAAFALLASLAGHDKQATDQQFLATLPLIQAASTDDRNFVIKGVSWALRRIGLRSPHLFAACHTLATELAASTTASARWLGKDALRDFHKKHKLS